MTSQVGLCFAPLLLLLAIISLETGRFVKLKEDKDFYYKVTKRFWRNGGMEENGVNLQVHTLMYTLQYILLFVLNVCVIN